MYVTLFLCVLAAWLISGDLAILMTGSMLIVAMMLRIKREEAMLREYFGEMYREYAKRTGTVVPKLRVFR